MPCLAAWLIYRVGFRKCSVTPESYLHWQDCPYHRTNHTSWAVAKDMVRNAGQLFRRSPQELVRNKKYGLMIGAKQQHPIMKYVQSAQDSITDKTQSLPGIQRSYRICSVLH